MQSGIAKLNRVTVERFDEESNADALAISRNGYRTRNEHG